MPSDHHIEPFNKDVCVSEPETRGMQVTSEGGGSTKPSTSAATPMSLEEGWAQIENEGINAIFNQISKIREQSRKIRETAADTGHHNNISGGGVRAIRNGKLQATCDEFDPCNQETWPVPYDTKQSMTLYTLVYKMADCPKEKHAARLYERFCATVLSYLEREVVPTLQGPPEVVDSDSRFLLALVDRWNEHLYLLKYSSKIFAYLERFYIKLSGVETIQDKGKIFFQTKIVDPFQTRIFEAYFNLLDEDRTYWVEKTETTLLPMIEIKLKEMRAGPSSSSMSSTSLDEIDDIAVIESLAGEQYRPSIDQTVLQNVFQMLLTYGTYSDIFTVSFFPLFTKKTKSYYSQLATTWLNTREFSRYLLLAAVILKLEDCRTGVMLGTDFLHREIVQTELLGENIDPRIFAGPITKCLEDNSCTDLARAYQLFCPFNQMLLAIATIFKEFIIKEGISIFMTKKESMTSSTVTGVHHHSLSHASSTQDNNGGTSSMNTQFSMNSITTVMANPELSDLNFVTSLISMHWKYQTYVFKVFKRDFHFGKAIKEAFEDFMNRDTLYFPSAAFLVAYIHRCVKSPQSIPHRSMVEERTDTEDALWHAIELFGYLTDKDGFAEGHKQALARRLIDMPHSISPLESYIIQQLKSKCGPQFAFKLEGMLNDMIYNQQINIEYQKKLQTTAASPSGVTTIEREVAVTHNTYQILTAGFWPFCRPRSEQIIAVPTWWSDPLSEFEKCYCNELTSHRRLYWMYALSSVTMTARFGTQEYDISCNGLQAIILDIFNSFTGQGSNYYLYSEIGQRSQMEDAILKKCLKSLYGGKYALLTRLSSLPDGSSLPGGNACFVINEQFRSQNTKFRLPLPFVEEGLQKDRVKQDKTDVIQAAIVSVLKRLKTAQHNVVVAEVTNKLTRHDYLPSGSDIKQNIDVLISKEYISASDDPYPNMYSYIP